MKQFWQNQFMFLWVPIIMAIGAALYFSAGTEPPLSNTIISTICLAAIVLWQKIPKICRAIGLLLFGFMYAACFTRLISTPQIKYDIRDLNTDAVVQEIDYSSDKIRAVLSINIDGRPANIRVTMPDRSNKINIGDKLNINANLFPPSQMDAPDTFDYARWAYFNNLTATGFITDYQIIESENTQNLNAIRDKIHFTANNVLTDSLILGYKKSLPDSEKQIWTNVGIAHIWSISGFHMTLIGGWLFIVFYLIFRAMGFITRRIPARIPATICAWCGLLFYFCISGGNVATLRAFIMTSLLFLAIILGRSAINMRNVCMAFLVMFLINPFYVMQVGFQLSFAAIFGLVWFWNKNQKSPFDTNITYNKFTRAIYTATMTTVIATLFTLPFIIANFDSVPVYSLLGNLIFVPIFSFIIMPLVVIGTLCTIFGGYTVLNIANIVYNFSLSIAHRIADLPYATVVMPHIPSIALGIIVFGMICIIFIVNNDNAKTLIGRKINYFIGGIIIMVGVGCVIIYPKPVFYITPDHELVGMVYDGKLEFNKSRASNHYFAFNSFRKLNGERPSNSNTRHKCTDGICLYKTDKFTVAYIQKFVPLSKNFSALCHNPDITYITSYFHISSNTCGNKILNNGFVIYQNGKIKYTPTNRWWHNQHE